MVYKYNFIDKDGNILTRGNDNTVIFGGPWGVQDSEGYPKWELAIYCYSNNGFSNNGSSYTIVTSFYVAQTGEALFDHEATEAELLAAFPGRAAAVKAQKLVELNAEYATLKSAYIEQYVIVGLADGENIETVRTDLNTEYKALQAQYLIDKAAITNG